MRVKCVKYKINMWLTPPCKRHRLTRLCKRLSEHDNHVVYNHDIFACDITEKNKFVLIIHSRKIKLLVKICGSSIRYIKKFILKFNVPEFTFFVVILFLHLL